MIGHKIVGRVGFNFARGAVRQSKFKEPRHARHARLMMKVIREIGWPLVANPDARPVSGFSVPATVSLDTLTTNA